MTRRHSITFSEPSLTRGSFRDEVDVNNIVRRFRETGTLVNVRRGEPRYGDAPDMDFFRSAQIAAEVNSVAELEALQGPSETPENEPEAKVAEVEKEAQGASESPQNGAETATESGA